jgi:hypothetical protein
MVCVTVGLAHRAQNHHTGFFFLRVYEWMSMRKSVNVRVKHEVVVTLTQFTFIVYILFVHKRVFQGVSTDSLKYHKALPCLAMPCHASPLSALQTSHPGKGCKAVSGVATRRAGGLRPSYYPLDTPCRTPRFTKSDAPRDGRRCICCSFCFDLSFCFGLF